MGKKSKKVLGKKIALMAGVMGASGCALLGNPYKQYEENFTSTITENLVKNGVEVKDFHFAKDAKINYYIDHKECMLSVQNGVLTNSEYESVPVSVNYETSLTEYGYYDNEKVIQYNVLIMQSAIQDNTAKLYSITNYKNGQVIWSANQPEMER